VSGQIWQRCCVRALPPRTNARCRTAQHRQQGYSCVLTLRKKTVGEASSRVRAPAHTERPSGAPLPHLPTSAPGLGSRLPHLPTSAPRLGSRLPHLLQDWAHPSLHLHRDCTYPCAHRAAVRCMCRTTDNEHVPCNTPHKCHTEPETLQHSMPRPAGVGSRCW
jgi:hypothetical protein